MYKILMQQRKIADRGIRVSVDHTYFGERGDTDGMEQAPDRYIGVIVDWKDKRSSDPKVKVKYVGEEMAVSCPLATFLEEQYGARFETFTDGSPPLVLEAAPAPARARAPAAAAPRAAAREQRPEGEGGLDDAAAEERVEDGVAADEEADEDDAADDDDGGPGTLSGSDSDDDDDDEDEADETEYDEVTVGEFTWTRLPADGVKTDARGAKPRSDGSFIKKTGISDIVHLWEYMCPPEFVEAQVKYTNPGLSQTSLGNDRLMTKGEAIQFWG